MKCALHLNWSTSLHYQKMSNNTTNNGGAETTAETLNKNLNPEKDTQKNKTAPEKDTQQETKAPEQNAQETTEKDTQQETDTKAKVIAILKKWGWKMALGVGIIAAATAVIMWINDVSTRGDSVRYANACQTYQEDSEPSIWRWASWDREVESEALLEWSDEFEYYYLNSDDEPTAQEKGMYRRACVLRYLMQEGFALEDAINVFPESDEVDTYVDLCGHSSLLR